MLDNKGSFYIIEGIIAVILLLSVFLIVNTTISIPSHYYSYESNNIKTAQDIMELLSGKIDFTDQSFLSKISKILKKDKYSKKAIKKVSKMSEEKLNSYNLKNYRFYKDKEILVQSGDWSKAENISSATRTYDNHSYILQIW